MKDELIFSGSDGESVKINYSVLRNKFINDMFLMSILELSDEEMDDINSEVEKLRNEYKFLNGIE